DAADQARVQTAGCDRARHRPPQGTPPHGPQSPRPCQRRCHQCRARCRRLQLPPPARVVEVFVAQNPNRARPSGSVQISMKPRSSRTTDGGKVMIRFFFLAPASLVFAAIIGQAAEMTFYDLPPGSCPNDVAPDPDGAVWFSGQSQGFAGRFDRKTGQLEKIPLGPGAAPHGVIVGPDGNAWLTEGGQNAIARVDAKSKEVKLFPLSKEF